MMPARCGTPHSPGTAAGRLDSRKVHVFDPTSGENLTRDAEAGAELTRMANEEREEQVQEARAAGDRRGVGVG